MHLFYEVQSTSTVKQKREIKRMSVLLISLVFSAAFLLSTIYVVTSAVTVSATDVSQPVTYVVGERDTLWEIAALHIPDQMDIRKYIEDIRRINDLESSTLMVGQRLLLP